MSPARGAAAAVIALVSSLSLGGCFATSVTVDGGPSTTLTTSAPAPDATVEGASDAARDGASDGAGYAVLETDETTGAPITYSPCRPVPYVTNLAGAPDGVEELVEQAVAVIAADTGLTFTDEGPTDEAPDPEREAQLAAYGDDAWAPVLIAWTDDEAIPDLAGDTVGLAGSQAYTDAQGRSAYVSGDVMLDGPDLSDILEGPDGEAQVRAVVLHELGHLVGLDHVDDPTQLMFAEDNPEVTEPAAGDLAGLAAMGAGPCVEDLATP